MRKVLPLFFLTIYAFGNMDSKKALQSLLEGNKRFINGEHTKAREAAIASQAPYAVVVTCSDSRVAPELIFDEGIGQLFVVRVAGNVIGPTELDSIEFGALYLHASVVLVMGHQYCGAVDAVVKGTTQDIEALATLIRPAVTEAKKADPQNLVVAATKLNAQMMAKKLQNNPKIKKLIDKGVLAVHSAYYNFETGEVQVL